MREVTDVFDDLPRYVPRDVIRVDLNELNKRVGRVLFAPLADFIEDELYRFFNRDGVQAIASIYRKSSFRSNLDNSVLLVQPGPDAGDDFEERLLRQAKLFLYDARKKCAC